MALLDEQEFLRYQRQIALPEFGLAGQARLKQGSVLIVGLGGLGTPAAQYLAAAGVGRLGLLDDDRVELHNLQRQILYTSADVGRLKIDCAAERLSAMNPLVSIERHPVRLLAENARDLIAGYDVVVDGTDHIATRQILNRHCVALVKPLVYGALFRFEGVASVFCSSEQKATPCYACLHGAGEDADGAAMDCNTAGVLGVLPGVIGVVQATEAIKILSEAGNTLAGRLLQYDALSMRTREFRIDRDPDCAVCGAKASGPESAIIAGNTRPPAPAMSPTATPAAAGMGGLMSVQELNARLATRQQRPVAAAATVDLLVLDVREAHELQLGALPGVIHIPVGQLPERLEELDRNREYAIICKAGGRSRRAARILIDAGFGKIYDVEGGMNAWAREIDPSLPEY